MPDNVISIGFDFDQNSLNALSEGLTKIQDKAAALPETLDDVKNSANDMLSYFNNETSGDNSALFTQLPSQMQKTFSAMMSTTRKEMESLTTILNSGNLSNEMTSAMRQSLGFQNANIRTLISSARQIGEVYNGIADDMKGSFGNALGDMMRDASRILRSTSSMTRAGIGSQGDIGYVAQLHKNKPFAEGISAVSQTYGLSPKQVETMLSGIVKHSVPFYQRADYWRQAEAGSGHQIKQSYLSEAKINDFRQRLPERYHALPVDPRKNPVSATAELQGNLTPKEYNQVKQVAAQNPSFEKALRMTGSAQRGKAGDKAGALIMPAKPISRQAYAEALGYMYSNMLIPALEGAPAYLSDLSSTDTYKQINIASKNSRVPRETYQAAQQLDKINISPVLRSFQSPAEYNHEESIAISDEAPAIRPDRFQIFSLTRSDFNEGKKLNTESGYIFERAKDGRTQHGSINKIFERSLYTDLLGLHGDNTYGNGSKTDVGSPKMIVMDVSDEVLAKDSYGKLIFKDGAPQRDEQAFGEISKIFERNKELAYTYNGEQKVYRYASMNYGDHGSYVPTNVKGTNIIFANEADYLARSKQSLEKYGVNIFDNFMDLETEYSSQEAMNKRTEARNRMLTPSVPITELGGVMPDKSKIAFVDMSFSGLDGSMMFMPGYIPGGDATVRAPGLKGVAQSVDYKLMIKDLFGDKVEQFYVPALDAPDDVKNKFKSEGIKAFSQDEIDRHFLDIMQYDALITDSVIKSDFYKTHRMASQGASIPTTAFARNAERQELLDNVLRDVGGLRVYKTAKEFWTDNKTSLSGQMSQNLDLTAEDIAENNRLWDEHIHALLFNPQKTLEMLFADPNDPLSQRVQKNVALMQSDPEAIARIRDAVQSAQMSRANNEMYARGDVAMGVALHNPGEWILAAARANGLQVTNEQLANVLSLPNTGKEAAIAAAQWADTAQIGAGRFPNNQLETFSLNNSQQYIRNLERYGLNPFGVYMNAATIAKMGGGDFDGDTVQMARRRLQEIISRTQDVRAAQLGQFANNEDLRESLKAPSEAFGAPRAIRSDDFASMLVNNALSIFKMSTASTTTDSLSQGNWNDKSWVNQIGRAAFDQKAIYDIDSTFAKTGVAAKWSKYAQDARYVMGKPFAHAFKNLAGAIENNDISQMGDLSKVNFPSIYNGLTVGNQNALQETPLSDYFVEQLIANQNALQGVDQLLASDNPALKARGEYMRFNNILMSKLITGRASAISNKDLDNLQALWRTWYDAAIPDGVFKTLDTDSPEVAEQKSALRLQQSRIRFAREFGVTEDRIRNRDGYAASGFYSQVRYTDDDSAYQVAATAEQDRMRAQAALLTGSNPHILNATQAIQAQTIAAQGINKANDLTYSYTMLSYLTGELDKQKQWYDQYIRGDWPERGENQFEKDVGDATHKAQEAYAKERIKNDAFQSSRFIDEMGQDKSFEDVFWNILQESPSFKNRPIDKNNVTNERISDALLFVRQLPELFKDREFISSEQKIALPLGNKRHPSGVGYLDEPQNTTGSIDIRTRMKNPDGTNNPNNPIIATDLKTKSSNTEAFDQLLLYAAGLSDKPGMLEVIGYRDKSIKEGKVTSVTKQYDAEEAATVLATAAAKVQGVFELAASTGLPTNAIPMDDMQRIFRPFAPSATAQAWRESRDAAFSYSSSQTGKKEENPQNEMLSMKRLPPEYQQAVRQRELIDSNTGRGIARAMSVEQELYAYANELSELGGKLRSKANRAASDEHISNPWETYDRMLTDVFDARTRMLGNKGASDDDKKRLEIFRDEANQAYQDALRISSVEDLRSFNKSIEKAMSSDNADNSTKSYIKQFDELSNAIARAKQAYDVFKNAMADKQKTNQPLTKAEIEAQETAEKELQLAESNKLLREEQIKRHAITGLDLGIGDLENSITGRQLSASARAQKDAYQMSFAIDTQRGNITALQQNNLITEQEARERLARIDAFDIDAYMNSRINFYESEASKRMAASTKRVENLRTQGRRLDRNKFGRNSNGLFSRSINEWESNKDRYDNRIAALKSAIEQEEKTAAAVPKTSDEYKDAVSNLKALKGQLSDTENTAKSFSGAMGLVGTVMFKVGQAVGQVVSQFGRQMFQKAAQEAKRFVQEFDAAMTEIQMITGKTNAEMDHLGGELIQTAIDMKVGVSDVTSAASDLYRQGLEDEDVNVRMEDIQKFSKVANIKSAEASKIITTALSNDLVESSSEAMDALVALGDSAATTASEIAKGMQKSAASAKQAGVSYEQLVTMLTIITSKTQLGGNQAGTALQTLMYRLYRVNEGEDFYDENGNRVAANQASNALKQLGVSIYDENGDPRGAYDIMVDIAKNWNNASNISQEMVLNALGAGRQRSNIATLIQGLAEDDGALADKYIKLASGSEGITDTKYLAYLDSLKAALVSVKSSFDQLVAAFSLSDSAVNVQDFISEFLQGLAAAEEETNGLTAVISGLGTAQLAQGVVTNPGPTLFAALTGGALYAVSKKGNSMQAAKPESIEKISTRISDSVNDYEHYQQLITESKTLVEQKSLTQLETETLQSNQNALSDRFGTAAINLDEASKSISDIATILNQAQGLLNQDFQRQFNAHVQAVSESINEEAVTTIVEANEIERLVYSAMGYNDYDEQYNGYTRSIQDINEPGITREYYQDYMGWLSNGELTLQKFFREMYVPNSNDIDYSKASALDVQALQVSQWFDNLLPTISFDAFKDTGIQGLSVARIKELLSVSSYDELLSIDSSDPYWRNTFDYNKFDGKQGSEAFEIVQARYIASLWRHIDQIFRSPDEFTFSDTTDELIYAAIEDQVRPAVSSLVDTQHVDAVMATYYNRVYSKMPDLSQLTGVDIGNILSEEWRNLASYYQLGSDAIYENYASDISKPIWQVTDQFGKIYGNLTYAQAETKRQEQTSWTDQSENAYNAAVSNEQSVMRANGEFSPTRMYYVSGLPSAPLMEYEEMMRIASTNSEAAAISSADNMIQRLKQSSQRAYLYQNPITGETDSTFYDLHSDETAYNRIWQRLYDDYYQHYFDLNLKIYDWIDGVSSAEFWAPTDENLDQRMFDYASNRIDKAPYMFIPDEPVRMDTDENNEDNTRDMSAIFVEALTSGLSAAELEKSGSGVNWNDPHMEFIMRNNINSISEFLNMLNQAGAADLKAVYTNNTSLAKQLDKALVKDSATQDGYARDEQGNLIVQDNGNIIWAEYLKTLAAETENYSSVATVNRISTAAYASSELEAQQHGTPVNQTVLNNLSGIIGETLTGKLQRASAQMYDREIDAQYLDEINGETIIRQGKDVDLPDSVRTYLNTLTEEAQQTAKYSDYRTWAEGMNLAIAQGMLRPDELEYVQALIGNLKYGFTGLTDGQRVHGANLLMQQIEAGTLSEYIASNDTSMIDAYSGGFSSLPAQVSYAQIMEDLGITKVDSEGNPLTGEDAGVYTLNDLDSIEEGSAAYEAIDEALQKVGLSAEDAKNAVEGLGDEIAAVEKPYGKLTDEVQQNNKAWRGNKREIANAFKSMHQEMQNIANNQFYREQYKQGATDSKTIDAIVAMTGFSKESVKEHNDEVMRMLDVAYQADLEAVQLKADEINDSIAKLSPEIVLPAIEASGGDLSGFAAAIAQYDADLAAMIAEFAADVSNYGFTAALEKIASGENFETYKINVGGLGTGKKASGGGGGGGSKKSAAQKLLEDQKREQTLWEHRRKMIQYQATRYENAGELTNYAIMLGHESKEIERQIKLREEQINQLKKQLATTKKYSDDWYEIRDAILSAEEALEDLINDNKELAVTIEEIEQKILELHIDLEKTVKDEIETRIQAERDMLNGTVSMQDIILEAIRERYRTEWELMQEDLDRKREALEEEIALIDERLQRRKDAEDEAAKHEELAELKRQLALVSMDSSRTKDQKQLREQIEELERELAWDSAEDEAEMQKDALQEQADAYSDYEEEYQKYLDDLLEDANNFSDEVNRVMAMGQEDMLRWLSENVEEFRLSLDASQKQMIQNWTDTFKQMKGIVDTYWAEIARTLSSKETFISYMKQSSTYQNASESEKAQLEHTWGKMYDDWISAKKESDEAKDWDHQETEDSADNSATTTRYRANYTLTWTGTDDDGNPVQMSHNGYGLGSSKYAAEGSAKIVAQNYIRDHGLTNVTATYNAAYKYAKGGLVDYTGFAWVDGTPSAPEAFLSATDTALVRSMLDAWQFIVHRPTISNVDSAIGHSTLGTSFGDIHIEITEASFADDADIEAVARRVGDAFTKELSKNGFRTASFNF